MPPSTVPTDDVVARTGRDPIPRAAVKLPWSEFKGLAWSISLFFTTVAGGACVLIGIVCGLGGVARDEDILSRVFLVCSPEERRVFTETVLDEDAGATPEPNLSEGSCSTSFDTWEDPERATVRISERLGSAGWRVRVLLPRERLGPLGGVLLTATRGRFYLKVSYQESEGGDDVEPGSGARLEVAVTKI